MLRKCFIFYIQFRYTNASLGKSEKDVLEIVKKQYITLQYTDEIEHSPMDAKDKNRDLYEIMKL